MIFFEHEGNRALRIGDWKIVAKGKAGQNNPKWEMYKITEDRGEMHDLSKEEPELFKEMIAQWRSKAEQVQAIPWPKSSKKKSSKKKKTKKKSSKKKKN